MAYKVYWDNGANACGTFPNEFDTEEEAQGFADNWMAEMNAADGIDPEDEDGYFSEDEDGCFAEVFFVEVVDPSASK